MGFHITDPHSNSGRTKAQHNTFGDLIYVKSCVFIIINPNGPEALILTLLLGWNLRTKGAGECNPSVLNWVNLLCMIVTKIIYKVIRTVFRVKRNYIAFIYVDF